MNIEIYNKLPKFKLIAFLKENMPQKNYTNKDISNISKAKKDNVLGFVLKNFAKEFFQKPLEYFEGLENSKRFNFEKKINLKKLTKKERENYVFNENNFDEPYIGKAPVIKKYDEEGKEIKQDIVKLESHQKKFLMGFLIGNLRCSIVFHGVGTGKTFTAVATANMYLQLYPKNKIVFISPPAVIYNFIESLAQYGIDPRDPRYHFMSYDKFYRQRKITTDNALLIVDEAHNFRTEMSFSSTQNAEGVQITVPIQNKKGFDLLNKGGKPAHKVLLLTATPFVNKLYDIENLLAIGEGRDAVNEETFGDICSDEKLRYDYFKYRVSHYEKEQNNSMFPDRIEKYIPLIVPEAQENDIRATGGKENPFYIHTRQVSSNLEDLKVDYVINEIKKNPDKKFVCYTTFKEYGYKPLEEMLNENEINYSIISGSVSTTNKKKAIDAFNNYDIQEDKNYNGAKCRVLIITRAGAEGVNLKRTHSIFVMDGQWNNALYEQIVARAIRFKSHILLPKAEQKVFVKKLFLCYKSEGKILNSIDAGKKIDYAKMLNVVLENREELNKLNRLNALTEKAKNGEKIKNIGIRKDDVEEFMNKIATFGDKEFDVEKLATMKKGSKEKFVYLNQNKAFAKNRESYMTGEMTRLLEKTPSTDFYMFLLQKNKSMIIDVFIKKLDLIPSTEKSIIDLEFGKKLFNMIVEKKLEGKEMMKLLIEHLRPEMKNIVKITEKITINYEDKLKQLLENRKALKDLQTAKNLVKIGQEYFTPLNDAEKLFKLSQLHFDFKKFPTINILEPTAGHGGLLQPIMKFFSDKNNFLKIDMVEFNESNRKVLNMFVEKAPDMFSLQKTRDFLEFTPNKSYDYIFMNPPFHLDKKLNKKYKKDYYDYDFVKRAYAMLELNGVLVAITGTKYKTNNDIIKWYKDKGAEIEIVKGKWEGDNLKKGAEIQNLERAFIRIRKFSDNPIETKELLKIDDFNIEKKSDIVVSISEIEQEAKLKVNIQEKIETEIQKENDGNKKENKIMKELYKEYFEEMTKKQMRQNRERDKVIQIDYLDFDEYKDSLIQMFYKIYADENNMKSKIRKPNISSLYEYKKNLFEKDLIDANNQYKKQKNNVFKYKKSFEEFVNTEYNLSRIIDL